MDLNLNDELKNKIINELQDSNHKDDYAVLIFSFYDPDFLLQSYDDSEESVKSFVEDLFSKCRKSSSPVRYLEDTFEDFSYLKDIINKFKKESQTTNNSNSVNNSSHGQFGNVGQSHSQIEYVFQTSPQSQNFNSIAQYQNFGYGPPNSNISLRSDAMPSLGTNAAHQNLAQGLPNSNLSMRSDAVPSLGTNAAHQNFAQGLPNSNLSRRSDAVPSLGPNAAPTAVNGYGSSMSGEPGAYGGQNDVASDHEARLVNANPLPELEPVIDFLVANLGEDWKNLARVLGFSEVEIAEISLDNKQLREKGRAMLFNWRKGYNGTHVKAKSDLLKGLRNKYVKLNQFAYKIEKNLIK